MRKWTKIELAAMLLFGSYMLFLSKVPKDKVFIGLLVFTFGILFLSYFFLPYCAKAIRKRRFINRPLQDFAGVFEQEYKPASIDKDVAWGLHRAIAEDIGIDPSQILPSDAFDRELAVLQWWGIKGDEFDYTDDFLFNVAGESFDWPDMPLDYFRSLQPQTPFTVRDLLIRLHDVLSKGARQ